MLQKELDYTLMPVPEIIAKQSITGLVRYLREGWAMGAPKDTRRHQITHFLSAYRGIETRCRPAHT